MNWRKIGGVALNIVSLATVGVTTAEIRFGRGGGEKKKAEAVETVTPVLERYATAGEIAMGVEAARGEIGRIIDGIVALFNLLGVFRR